jgi:hypothetical protein
MSDQEPRDPALSAGDIDDRWQMAVLGHLLLAYPAPFTFDEIVTAFETPFQPRTFDEADGIQRAVRDLVCAGLLRESDGAVLPTRATFRFSELVGL